MKRLRAAVATLAILPLALSTIAADFEEGCVEEDRADGTTRTVCTERVYWHCADDTIKVANATSLNDVPTFDSEPPEGSVSEGAGCGALDTFLTGASDDNPIYDAPFGGFWMPAAGISDLDRMTIRMHVIDAGTARVDDSFHFRAHVRVAGETLITRESEFEVVPVPSSTGISREIVLTIDDIGLQDLEFVDVKITLYARYVDTNQNIWVWDTIEVPSGIDFNPPTAEGHVVKAFAH